MNQVIKILLSFSTIFISANISPAQQAGRNRVIGDKIPEAIFSSHEISPDLIKAEKKTFILVFTKEKQKYSQRLKKEFLERFATIPADSITFINIHNGEIETELPSNWVTIRDSSFNIYSQFGLRVYPTTIITNTQQELLAYFPGYNQGTVRRVTDFLSTRYPTLFEIPRKLEISRKDKKQKRREAFIQTLYYKGKYNLALLELSKLDSLSAKDNLIFAFILLRQNELDSAKTVFGLLENEPKMESYYHVGLGLIEYKSGNYERALMHLNKVQTIKDMHRVHYWRGMTYKHLGDYEHAIKEFETSARQTNRRVKKRFLP